MGYLTFRKQFFDLACFSIDQVYAWQPSFDRNNLHRWVKKHLIVRLRRGYYTFPEYKEKPDYAWYFANRIYKPSYISLQTALAFYGLIPEAVVQISSVSTLKTAEFNNELASFSYNSISNKLMFGYVDKSIGDNKSILFASPEKALLDLLYLNPEYNTSDHLQDLRLDYDLLHDEVDTDLLKYYAQRFQTTLICNA